MGVGGPHSLLPRGQSDFTRADGVPPPTPAGQTGRAPRDPSAGERRFDRGRRAGRRSCLAPRPVIQQGPYARIS